MPKSLQRCVTSLSVSSNVPSSRRNSMRSRADILPSLCWRSRRLAPPPSSASWFRLLSSATFCSRFMGKDYSLWPQTRRMRLITGTLVEEYVVRLLDRSLFRSGGRRRAISQSPCLRYTLHNVSHRPDGLPLPPPRAPGLESPRIGRCRPLSHRARIFRRVGRGGDLQFPRPRFRPSLLHAQRRQRPDSRCHVPLVGATAPLPPGRRSAGDRPRSRDRL